MDKPLHDIFARCQSIALAILSVTGTSLYAAPVESVAPVYHLPKTQVHYRFSSNIKPALTVPPGAMVIADLRDSADGQIGPASTANDLHDLDMSRVHPLTGPVFVEGAEPGNVLAVTILEVEPGNWGWSALFPGFGALEREFKAPYLRTFAIGDDRFIRFNNEIRIPLRPFPGLMGVAPPTEELLSTMPPRENGGNMDDPDIGVGTTLYFPVFVKGALFSLGDGHAVQGRGEVGGPTVEIPMRVTFKLDLMHWQRPLQEPQYQNEKYYAVMSSAPTLDEAARKAVGYMVDYLAAEHGLSRQEAYMLCTLAADLMVNEIPNKPNVSMTLRIAREHLGK